MVKKKTQYVCQSCGAATPKWEGKCPQCGEWNSLVEEIVYREKPAKELSSPLMFSAEQRQPIPVTKIVAENDKRLQTGINEFDRILGGGIFPGSVSLIGGEPGIGKSTLLLQVFGSIAKKHKVKVLYITGEESPGQIRFRADRLNVLNDNLLVVSETNIDSVIDFINDFKPAAIVVDSIQTLYSPMLASAPGSVGQLRECASRILYSAKNLIIPVFLIGHVTKAGIVAGPRVLEHMVDTVLYFEGEGIHSYRILRAVKNRFGATNEIGVFEMTEQGLMEISNPSELFLSYRPKNSSGSAVSAAIEGSRSLLVEIQALTIFNGGFGAPRRSTSGIDPRRLALLLAVLEKRAGIRFFDQDVFINVAGGIKVEEPSVDLALVLAVVSSYKNIPINPSMVVIGEVGLGGEVRTVGYLENRLKEVIRLGFKSCLTAPVKNISKVIKDSIEMNYVNSIRDAVDLIIK